MKRSDDIRWSQVKVGIFIVCALIFLGGGVLLMGKQTKLFTPKGQVSVVMPDVAGLKVGAPVWLAGIDVGVVTGIRFERPEKTNDVDVQLEVDREALKKIGSDSVVTVKTRGLMGEKYVDITPSRFYSHAPPARLTGTPTVQLDDVMRKAGTTFDMVNGIVRKVNNGEGTIGRFAQDPQLYDNLVVLTKELQAFAYQVNHGQGTLGKLTRSTEPYDKLMSILSRAENTLGDIQHSEGTLSKLIRDRELYDKLVQLADKSIKAADDVRELNKRITSPDSTLGMIIGNRELYDKGIVLLQRVDNSLKSLEEITTKIDKGEGTAAKVINEKQLYNKLNNVVEDLDALVKDVKENPRKYIKFSVF